MGKRRQTPDTGARSVSLARLRANRANATKSTGPKTIDGKAKSSLNAVRHGLTAVHVVLDGEDPIAFEKLRQYLVEYHHPATPIEYHAVDQVAGLLWRLRRVPIFEASLLTWIAHSQAKAYDKPIVTLGTVGISIDEFAIQSPLGSAGRRHLMLCPLTSGRVIHTAIMRGDMLGKLGRYESHLVSQLIKILSLLNKN